MKWILRMLPLVLLATDLAGAQTTDMRIMVNGVQLTANGAEQPAGVSRGVDLSPSSMGKPTSGAFSAFGCGSFSLNVVPGAPFSENAYAGWRVEITPMQVAANAVTFRLRWVRALDTGKGFAPANEDIELTLRPGESRPLDSVGVPARAGDTRSCNVKASSLRVSVEFDMLDRRLIGADVWLVERLPNGKEDSQLQSVRGLPHRDVPFFFDSVSDGTRRLDFFGRLIAELRDGGIQIHVQAVRASADGGQVGYQSARWFASTIHMMPGEIVEVTLTPADGDVAGPFTRVFALRIRAKQIR